MNNRLIRNYPLIPPLLIGIISVFGICLILGVAWLPKQNVQTSPTQTVTPFKYLLLATLTVVPTVKPETSTPTAISLTQRGNILTLTATLTTLAETSNGDASLLIPLITEQTAIPATDDFFTQTATITTNSIFAEATPMTIGKYDDIDPNIIRNGNWTSQHNIEPAYQKTLLISNTVGSYVAFRFIGRQIVLGYQSSANTGDMTVNIDGAEVTITQRVGNAWFSQELEFGTHSIILTHYSGTSINMDYIDIPN